MSEQREGGRQSLSRGELLRRQIATSGFVGLDPFHYSCNGPIIVAPLPERAAVQDTPGNNENGYVIHIDRATGDMTVTQLDKTEQGGNDE